LRKPEGAAKVGEVTPLLVAAFFFKRCRGKKPHGRVSSSTGFALFSPFFLLIGTPKFGPSVEKLNRERDEGARETSLSLESLAPVFYSLLREEIS
jgi:hypothetical protein